MCVQNCSKLSSAVHELSTVKYILDSVDFDRDYLWKVQAIDKRKTALRTTSFSTFDENNLLKFGPLTKK